MAITYTWTISALDCRISEEGMSDVVQTVHWRYRGTDEDNVTYETYSATSVPTPNPEGFIPYPDLDLTIVTGWLESIINMQELQGEIAAQIELIKHPVMVTLPLPTGSVSL